MKIGKYHNKLYKLFKKVVPYLHFFYLAAYFTVFLYTSYRAHLNLDTHLFDFGIQHHVIYNTSQGKLFQSGVETQNYLGDHFSPIILPLALIYRIFPGAITLFALQTLSVTFFLLGVYKLSMSFLENHYLAWAILIVASFYPGLAGLLLYEFHPVALAPPFLIWGIYFWITQRKYFISILLFVLATFCKEDVGLFVFGFGIWNLVFRRREHNWILSLGLSLYGIFISTFALFWVIPFFRQTSSDTLRRYEYLGSNGLEMLKTILTKPLYVLGHLAKVKKIYYIIKMMEPVSFLILLSSSFIIVVIALLENIFSNSAPQVFGGVCQYDAMVTVGVFFSLILSIGKIVDWLADKHKIDRQVTLNFIAILLISTNVHNIYTHRVVRDVTDGVPRYKEGQYDYLRDLQARIPDEAIVAVDNVRVGGQFSRREKLQVYNSKRKYSDKPDYAIIHKPVFSESVEKRVATDLQDNYMVWEENDRFLVLKKE